MPKECSHLDQITFRKADEHVCEECVKMRALFSTKSS
jgi:hypothetical protein